MVGSRVEGYVEVGEFGCVEVGWVNELGGFVEWGVMKELLVGLGEEKMKMEKGKRYVVDVDVDEES